ncbi:MAG: glycosyltransferase [Candidatus Methanomethyliaceae archaeon]
MSVGPKITFCIIVFNGEPFTKYCLRAIYPYAYEIIVSEGAVEAASELATHDGRSTDGTVESLVEFKSVEDVENKLKIIQKNGFWGEKYEQSRVCFEKARGDYVWQIDIDEFYLPSDMERVIELLEERPEVAQISFKQTTFWGGLEYIVDSWYLRDGAEVCHRVFKWEKGFRYVSHRPPTVVDTDGRSLRTVCWLANGHPVVDMVRLYHYSLVFPKNVREKSRYYSRARWAKHSGMAERWAENVFEELRNPFRVHNVYTCPSWLERFRGKHPPIIYDMMRDIRDGKVRVDFRTTDDVERVLGRMTYRAGRLLLKMLGRIYCSRRVVLRRLSHRALREWNRVFNCGIGR